MDLKYAYDLAKQAVMSKKKGYTVQDIIPLVIILVVVGVMLGFGSVFLATFLDQPLVNASDEAVTNIGYAMSSLGTLGSFLGLIALAIVFGIALGVLLGMVGGIGGGQPPGRTR